MKYHIFYLVIIGLLTSVLFLRKPDTEIIEYTSTDTLWLDSIQPYEVVITEWRDKDIDTLAVIEDYFSRKKYSENLVINEKYLKGGLNVTFEQTQGEIQNFGYTYSFDIEKPRVFRNSLGLEFENYENRISLIYQRDILNNRFIITGRINQKSVGVGLLIRF